MNSKYGKRNIHAFNEITALNKLQHMGFRIVKPYLGYYDKAENRSFMFYEFKDERIFKTLKSLDGKIVTYSNIEQIQKHLFNKLFDFSSIQQFADVGLKHIFVDTKTKELYLFDILDDNLIELER